MTSFDVVRLVGVFSSTCSSWAYSTWRDTCIATPSLPGFHHISPTLLTPSSVHGALSLLLRDYASPRPSVASDMHVSPLPAPL